MAKKQQQKRQTKGSAGFNRRNSENFLEKNRHKPGVLETESGLQYLILDDGDGKKPTCTDTVQVQQRIALIDGTVIADDYKKSNISEFTMQEAIEGYREGLLLMQTGARYRFFIPSDLAWGKRGAGNKIGPYAALIIDARLTSVSIQ